MDAVEHIGVGADKEEAGPKGILSPMMLPSVEDKGVPIETLLGHERLIHDPPFNQLTYPTLYLIYMVFKKKTLGILGYTRFTPLWSNSISGNPTICSVTLPP